MANVLGTRLRLARRRAGLRQVDLGKLMGIRQRMVSEIERGKRLPALDKAMAVARELNVSLDWLVGLIEEAERSALPANVEFVPIFQEQAMGGAELGSVGLLEDVAMPFRRVLLDRMGIDPLWAKVFRVFGETMHPTLPDGAAILVDYQRNIARDGRIYVYRHQGVVMVKRAMDYEGDLWWRSDNMAWPMLRNTDDFEVWGEVRWTGRSFENERAL